MHYKLDLGIDHVLIDEAQDTSPKQWEIVAQLVAEFFAGAGARANAKRTIFAVGDEKQSIFSFQGAAPRASTTCARQFARQFDAAELGWRYVRFRPFVPLGRHVLGGGRPRVRHARDLSQRHHRRGRHSAHSALPDAAPGLVELWPLIAPDEQDARSRAGTRRSTPSSEDKPARAGWRGASPRM